MKWSCTKENVTAAQSEDILVSSFDEVIWVGFRSKGAITMIGFYKRPLNSQWEIVDRYVGRP